MSTWTQVALFCDAEGCHQEVRLEGFNEGGTNITRALYAASHKGWQRTKGKDYCPRHRTTPLRFHAFVPGNHPSYWCDAKVKRGGRPCWEREDAFIHTGGQPT